MAGTKISELPVATALTGAELVPVVQSGATKQTTLAQMPYVPAGTGAVTTTVQAKLRETVSVKDFGAVGDGVADDTAAIQAAIDAVFAAGGGTVNFPTSSGDYITTAPILWRPGVRLDFDACMGSRAAINDIGTSIKKTNNSTVTITNYDTGATYTVDCIIYTQFTDQAVGVFPSGFSSKNMRLTGGASNTTGVHVDFASRVFIENAVAVGVTNGFFGRNVFISKLDGFSTTGKIVNSQAGTSFIYDRCSALGGFSIQGLSYSSMRNCTCDGLVGASAYTFRSCNAFTAESCGAESVTSASSTEGIFKFNTGNNDITLIEPYVLHANGSTSPVISIGDYDRVKVIGGNFTVNYASAPSAYDVYGASNSWIEFDGTNFVSGNAISSNPLKAALVGPGTYASFVIAKWKKSVLRVTGTLGSPATTTYSDYYPQQDAGVSWTPVLTGSTTAGTGTYTTQVGQYTQIEKLVRASAEITWTAHTGAGQLYVSLPVDATTTGPNFFPVNVISSGIALAAGAQIVGLLYKAGATRRIQLYTLNAGVLSPLAVPASGSLYLSFVYDAA